MLNDSDTTEIRSHDTEGTHQGSHIPSDAMTPPPEPLDGTKLCVACHEIGLEKFLDRGFDGPDAIDIYGETVTESGALEHVISNARYRTCSMCIFLAHMLGNAGQEPGWKWDKNCLCVGSAKIQYGIDSSEVRASFLLWIEPSRRVTRWRLPQYLPFKPQFVPSGLALELTNDERTISGRHVGVYTDFELLKSWLDDCLANHEAPGLCHTDSSTVDGIPGFTVIDCWTQKLVPWSALFKTEDRQFLALSYVWGKPTPSTGNDMETSSSANTSSLPTSLPQVIKDAMLVVTKLRYRYLWVDRYCIPQDDVNAKHTQIQRMDRIYGSSILTIIAAAGDDPSYGLRGVSPRLGKYQTSISIRLGRHTLVTSNAQHFPGHVRDSTWNTRGWTFQEVFLSSRSLIFSEDSVYFQCSYPRTYRFESVYEPPAVLRLQREGKLVRWNKRDIPSKLWPEDWAGLISQPRTTFLPKTVKEAGDSNWTLNLVRQYWTRKLSFESDSLNAFIGMLRHFQSLDPPVYNAWGLLLLPDLSTKTRYDLVSALAWSYHQDRLGPRETSTCPECRKSPNDFDQAQPRRNLFPSWSWADWRSEITVAGGQKAFAPSMLKIEGNKFTPLVELKVELDDGTIAPWDTENEDILRLMTSHRTPRVLHLYGYTSLPILRNVSSDEQRALHSRTYGNQNDEDVDERDELPKYTSLCEKHSRCWVWTDMDGEYLQCPLEPGLYGLLFEGCGNGEVALTSYGLQGRSQTGNGAETSQPLYESVLQFRVVILGYDYLNIYYLVLMEVQGTTVAEEKTYQRVNAFSRQHPVGLLGFPHEPRNGEEIVARLQPEHPKTFRGSPWTKMSTRLA